MDRRRDKKGEKEEREDSGWAQASLGEQCTLNSFDLERGAKSPDILHKVTERFHSKL